MSKSLRILNGISFLGEIILLLILIFFSVLLFDILEGDYDSKSGKALIILFICFASSSISCLICFFSLNCC